MASALPQSAIREGDQVILKKDKNIRVVQVHKTRLVWMEKVKFTLDNVIGEPFGGRYEVKNQRLIKVHRKVQTHKDDDSENAEKDNRNLVDGSGNQKLSRDDIEAMKKGGVEGHNIVEQLIENSATFSEKTDFAQEKYIKKKKQKYLPVFTVLRPTTRLLAEMYFNKGPLKICNLRVDSLAQILNEANVRACNKLIMVESCLGLVLGAVMERMAGEGVIINLFTGTAPSRPAMDAYNFPEKCKSIVYDLPLDQVHSLEIEEESAMDPEINNSVNNSSTTERIDLNGGSTVDPVGGESSTVAPSERSCVDTSIDTSTKPSKLEAPCIDGSRMEKGSVEGDSSVTPNTQNAAGDREDNSKTVENTDKEMDCSESRQFRGAGSWKKRKFVSEKERLVKKGIKTKMIQDAKSMLKRRDMDGLIVASRFHPTLIALSLVDYVAPSRPIVIFCQHKEPLLDCYMKLKKRGGVVLMKLSESWFREYQVLPCRTHPQVNMSGTGGYLLTGTTVERPSESGAPS